MSPAFEGRQIVILSSIDWDAPWQRHQIFAEQLARAGHEVFFVENSGFRDPGLKDLGRVWRKAVNIAHSPEDGAVEPVPGVRVVPPRVLPPTNGLFRKINEKIFLPQLNGLLDGMGLEKNPIVITYFPTATALEMIRRLSPSLLIYDCASNFRGHPNAPVDLLLLEKELLSLTDQVVCDSDFLYKQKTAEHPQVAQIHQGVPARYFDAKPPDPAFRRFCYYGSWSPDLDDGLVSALAEAGFEVTVSGYTKGPEPAFHPAVRRLAPTDLDKLLARLENFDAFLMPYKLTPFHMGVVPAKIYECLAMGRPVLATPLPSLKGYSEHIHIAETPEQWVKLALELPKTETPERRQARVALAREHTYEAEFARLHETMRQAWTRRKPRPEASSSPAAWWTGRHAQSFLKGFTWVGFLYGSAKIAMVATQILAGRLLGPAAYGQANLVIALAAFLQILPMLGFPVAVKKFLSQESSESERTKLISTTLWGFLLWGLAWLAVLELISAPLEAALALPDRLFKFSLLFSFANAAYVVVSSPLLGLYRFARRGLSETVYGLSAPIFLGAFVAAGVGTYEALVLALISSFLCGTGFSLWSLKDYLRPVFDSGIFRRIFGYASVAALNLVTMACIIGPARLILNRHFSAHEVGVFSAYFTATVQISLALLYMLGDVVVPIASSAEGQRAAWPALKRLGPAVFGAAFAFFCATACAALLVFGRKYPFHWSWVGMFGGAAALVLAHGLTASILAARDFSGLRISVAGSLVAGLGNLGLGLLLIPRFGISGAAAALLCAYVAGLAYYALFSKAPEAGPA